MSAKKPHTRNIEPATVEWEHIGTDRCKLVLTDHKKRLKVRAKLNTYQWTLAAAAWLERYAKASEQEKSWMDRQLAKAKGQS